MTQPIEIDGRKAVKVTAVEVGHASNVRVSRVGVRPLRETFLLGPAHGPSAPKWSSYSKAFTVTSSHPGQAVAELQVIDRDREASAGPFVITYLLDGRRYRTDAILSYRITRKDCP